MQLSEFFLKGCSVSAVCFPCDNATIVLVVKHQSLFPPERVLLLELDLACMASELARVVIVSVCSAGGCLPSEITTCLQHQKQFITIGPISMFMSG